MKGHNLRILTLFLALILCLSLQGVAQTAGNGSLRGTVKDPTGAVVPGADVTLVYLATQDRRATVTDAQGGFFFAALRPGSYKLTVELPGFKRWENPSLTLSPAESRGLDVTLQLGEMSETVQVVSQSEFIKTETPTQSDTITSQQIDNLSIISRSSLELLRVLPGVVAPDGDQLESVSFGGGANSNSAYTVNGVRGINNSVQIDGSQMIDIGSNNGTMLTANPEMVQEVTIQTSNYSAEYGTSGVQITAVTKGGTSDFHGTVYDYIRHYKLAANDRSRNYFGVERPKSKYQYPGFNVGGPVLIPGTNFNKDRDKLFFFLGMEWQRQEVDQGGSQGVVPTLAQRTGDFSEFLRGNYLAQPNDVLIPGGFEGAGEVAPNNDLTPYAHPVGLVFMNIYPQPNLTGNDRYNYFYAALAPTNRMQLIMRFDYNFTDNTKLYVRLGRETEDQDFARGLWWASSNFELPSHVLGTNLGRSVSGNLVSVLNPTTTNELLLSASKLKLDNDYKDPDSMRLSTLGIGDFRMMFDPSLIRNDYVPVNYQAWGQAGGNMWEPGGLPMFAHNDSISLNDNVNKVMNAHALKFGAYIEQANKIQNFNGNDEGQFAIQGDRSWVAGTTGNNYGDLLVGHPEQFAQTTSTPVGHFRFWNYETFVQDNWKVKPGLTLELGLRVGYWPNNVERDSLAIAFDPSSYVPGEGTYPGGDINHPNGMLFADEGQIPKGISQNPRLLWMPRVGFAWDVRGDASLVLRAGGGIFYNRPQGNSQYWVLNTPPRQLNTGGVDYNLGNGEYLNYDNIRTIDPYTRLGSVATKTQTLGRIDMPQTISMSLSIATRLPYDNILETAYVGTRGRHLYGIRNLNIIPEGALLSGTVGNADLSVPVQRYALDDQALALFRPFPAYQNVDNYEFSQSSNYHSLQVTLRRQAGERFQYYATYTFSKALGSGIAGDNQPVDPVDVRNRDYGVLPYDRTHIFNMSYTYQIPSLAMGNFRNGFTQAVFDGWQMSGITTFQSGTPIRLSLGGPAGSTDYQQAAFGTNAFRTGSAPVYTCNPQGSSNANLNGSYLNLDCLQIAPFGDTGPFQPPYYMKTPARWNFDVSVFKDFDFGEDRRLQFRAGFFNLFNQAYPVLTNGNTDIRLTLDTICNQNVDNVPNGIGGTVSTCDPTQGFSFDPLIDPGGANQFGEVTNKHGRRVIELALKFYF
ncbi:MAG: carboxypeptidase regulatory-like domain-containing protein [Acidobacteriota bacterium]